MRSWALIAVLTGGLTALFHDAALAQRPQANPARASLNRQIFNRPTVSPYLNLLRQPGTGMPNYQSLVRPLVEQRRTAQMQQNQIRNLQQQVSQQSGAVRQLEEGVRPTGHTSFFMNTLQFYPSFAPRR